MFRSSRLSVVLVVVMVVMVVEVQAQRQPGRRDCVVDGVDMCQYESHREMINKLQSLQRQYPHIVKVGRLLPVQARILKFSPPARLYREVSVRTSPGLREAEQRCWSEELPGAHDEVCWQHAR